MVFFYKECVKIRRTASGMRCILKKRRSRDILERRRKKRGGDRGSGGKGRGDF